MADGRQGSAEADDSGADARERERWYAILLFARGWTASATAEALGRDQHTIGRWASAFYEGGSAGQSRLVRIGIKSIFRVNGTGREISLLLLPTLFWRLGLLDSAGL